METAAATHDLLTLYPRILHACQARQVRDGQRLVSRNQATILLYLDEVEPITVNTLARHLGVTAGTMSLAIDRLERQGYVVRLRDGHDRRRVLVRLSSAGVRVREATMLLDPARVAAVLSRLAEIERAQVIAALRLLTRAIQHDATGADKSTDGRDDG